MSQTSPSAAAVPPLVSVVIPTFNCEPYIAQTLASVLAQTHRRIEVVVVDDGSTDRTAEIVQSHGDPVRLVRQSNQGVCVARNHGLEQSRGEFVCFLDHDDHWFPWKLQRQLEFFAADATLGVVFTDFALWNAVNGAFPDPQTLAPDDSKVPTVDADFSGYIYHQFLLDCFMLTSTAMMRREIVVSSGGFDPALPFSEDWDLWLRLSREHRFLKIASVSTLYRQHASQGNRVPRPIDYRTRLLESARRTGGLASRDGRKVDEGTFNRTLAGYHMQYALHQLAHDRRRAALRSMWLAWRRHPTRLKYLAFCSVTLLGWKPGWMG